MLYVISRYGIHVMNKQTRVNFIPRHTQIASKITHDDVITNTSPITTSVEPLVQPSIETEGTFAYDSL